MSCECDNKCEGCKSYEYTCRVLSRAGMPIIYFNDCGKTQVSYKACNSSAFDATV